MQLEEQQCRGPRQEYACPLEEQQGGQRTGREGIGGIVGGHQVRAMAGPTLCRNLHSVVRTSSLLMEGFEQGKQDLPWF